MLGLLPEWYGMCGLLGLIGLFGLLPKPSQEFTKSKADAQKDISDFTGIISTQFRAIAITLLTLTVVCLAKPSEKLLHSEFLQKPESVLLLLVIGVLAFAGLMVDYFHYLEAIYRTRLLLQANKALKTPTDNIPDYIAAPEFRTMRVFFGPSRFWSVRRCLGLRFSSLLTS